MHVKTAKCTNPLILYVYGSCNTESRNSPRNIDTFAVRPRRAALYKYVGAVGGAAQILLKWWRAHDLYIYIYILYIIFKKTYTAIAPHRRSPTVARSRLSTLVIHSAPLMLMSTTFRSLSAGVIARNPNASAGGMS